jgi:flagellar motor switch protein FliN
MKDFLEAWAEAFPDAVMQKLGVEVVWEPADELPAAKDAVALEMLWEGEWRGRCVLVGAWQDLARLMGEAAAEEKKGKKTGTPNEEARGRWRKWMRETLEGMMIPEQPKSMELVDRPRGVPLAPFVLRAEGMAVRLALVAEVKTEPEALSSPQAGSAGSSPEGLGAPAASGTGNPGLDLLLDIEVDASLRFGSRELAIHELLATGPGDVLELDRTVNDPVDLVVGDKIVARGEVVLVNGNFGLRVTEVAEPRKCLESVRCLFGRKGKRQEEM